MNAPDVLAVLDALAAAGVRAWVAGGWGIDALVGEATRPHRDLDLAVPADQEAEAIATLGRLGFGIADDQRPARLVLGTHDGRTVDVHPVAFDADGLGVQQGFDGQVFEYPPDAFGSGLIEGREVPCLTAAQQVRFHLGYEPLDHDRRDMALLRDRLGISVPEPY